MQKTRKVLINRIEMFRKVLNFAEKGDIVGLFLRGVGPDDVERVEVLIKQ